LINVVELAATHSTTYKLKCIILHCAAVIVIIDVNVVDLMVVVGVVVILVVVVVVIVVVVVVDVNVVDVMVGFVIVVVVSMIQVPVHRRFQKNITVQHDLNMLFCTWDTHLF